MEGGVQEADDHGPRAHDPENPAEIAGLKISDLVQGFVKILHSLRGIGFILGPEDPVVILPAPGFGSLGVEQHLADRWQPDGVQEHVLRAAEADALGAHVQGLDCV